MPHARPRKVVALRLGARRYIGQERELPRGGDARPAMCPQERRRRSRPQLRKRRPAPATRRGERTHAIVAEPAVLGDLDEPRPRREAPQSVRRIRETILMESAGGDNAESESDASGYP